MLDRSAAKQPAAWQGLAVGAGLLAYLGLFYGAHDERWQSLLLLLMPDDLFLSWVGGDLRQLQVLDRLPLLALVGLLLGTAFLVGQATLQKLRCDRVCSTLEQIAFALGVGLSELSLVTLALGLCGVLRQRWLFVLLIGAVWGVSLWRWRRGGFAALRRDSAGNQADRSSTAAASGGRVPLGSAHNSSGGPAAADHGPLKLWLERYGSWLAAPFVTLVLLGSLLPPWEFDVREYHLQVPKEWYLQGRIDFLPHNVYGNMPLGAELPALLAMTLLPGPDAWWWGALAGKAVIASFSLLTAVALLAAGQRFATRTVGVVAALVYLSTPWTVSLSVTGLIDGAVGCYLLLACYAWAIGRSTMDANPRDGNRWVWLSGFLAGSAAACKYPGFVFVVAPLFLVVLFMGRTVNWKPAVCFVLAVTCGCGLWLAKNWWFTGDPLYPLLGGGATRTAEQQEQWNHAHRVPRDTAGRRYSFAQAAEALAVIGWRSSGLSPLLVPFAVLGLLAGKPRRLVWRVGILLTYVLGMWWLGTHRLERFLVPALPLASLLAGLGAAWFATHTGHGVLSGIVAVGLVANLLFSLGSRDQDHRYLVGLKQLRRDEPAEPNGPSRVDRVHRYLNDTVADGDSVLLVGDAQPFDLEVPALYNTCFDDCQFELLLKGRSRAERLAAFRERRISYVYVHWSEIRRYRSPGNYGFTDYVTHDRLRELVVEQGLLRPLDLGLDPQLAEVFAVVDVRP